MSSTIASQRRIPALDRDRAPLLNRGIYDFSDYGFHMNASLSAVFEIVPIETSDQEAFLFFYPKDQLRDGTFSLFNLHAFLKRTGSLEDFAHSLGPSVRNIALENTTALGVPAKIYHRTIAMKELFEGAPQVIDFIGGRPELLVVDSHLYFQHRHNHYYSGMIHEPGNDDAYDTLRRTLLTGIRLIL
jgi:hypothetical protein